MTKTIVDAEFLIRITNKSTEFLYWKMKRKSLHVACRINDINILFNGVYK